MRWNLAEFFVSAHRVALESKFCHNLRSLRKLAEHSQGRDRLAYNHSEKIGNQGDVLKHAVADWMALRESETTRAFHINLVRHGAEEEAATDFSELLREEFRGRCLRATWESIYDWSRASSSSLGQLCSYMEQKTAKLQRAFRCK